MRRSSEPVITHCFRTTNFAVRTGELEETSKDFTVDFDND